MRERTFGFAADSAGSPSPSPIDARGFGSRRVAASDVYGRLRQRPAANRHRRLLEAECGEQARGVQALGERERRALELRREVAGVHRVELAVDRIGLGFRFVIRRREGEHVGLDDAERAGDRRVFGLVGGRPRVLADGDVDRDDVAAAFGERSRDSGAVTDADLQQPVAAGEFFDERQTGR